MQRFGMTNYSKSRHTGVSMGLTVNRQIAKKSTINRQKRNIFTVNLQMSEPKLALKFLFLIFLFLKQFFETIYFIFFIFFKQLLIPKINSSVWWPSILIGKSHQYT